MFHVGWDNRQNLEKSRPAGFSKAFFKKRLFSKYDFFKIGKCTNYVQTVYKLCTYCNPLLKPRPLKPHPKLFSYFFQDMAFSYDKLVKFSTCIHQFKEYELHLLTTVLILNF